MVFHDPCYLSRLGGVAEEPRYILRYVAENFCETPENRMDTYCCGGGGFLKELDNELRLKIGAIRLKHALNVGAEIIASACPYCKTALTDTARDMGSKVEVLDLAELLAKQMGIA